MKAILTLVISFCLLHIQVHTSYNSFGFGFTKAKAQTSEIPQELEMPIVEPPQNNSTPPSTPDEGPSYSVEDEEKIQKVELLWALSWWPVLLIIIVMLAPALLMGCKSQWDIWIYGASSLYFIAAEIMNFGKYKQGSEQEMTIYANKDKDEQIEAMMAAHTETKQAAEAAQTKANNSLYASIGFGYLLYSLWV